MLECGKACGGLWLNGCPILVLWARHPLEVVFENNGMSSLVGYVNQEIINALGHPLDALGAG